jgi:hypothetical protein
MLNVGSKKSSVMCAEKNAWRNYTRNEFTINKFWLTVNSTFYGVALTGISISVFFSLFYRFH